MPEKLTTNLPKFSTEEEAHFSGSQKYNFNLKLKGQAISRKKYNSFSREACQTILQVILVFFIDTGHGES